MNKPPFQRRLRNEWQRLNPRYVKPEDTFWQSFLGGLREGLQGFFAPLRLLWWLVTRSWK